jgi:SAM-dependent methyltransferase
MRPPVMPPYDRSLPPDAATRRIRPELPPGLLSRSEDLFVYCCRAALGADTTLPLPQDGRPRILEMGCRTGFWGREIARQYPSAEVIGIDPIIPTLRLDGNWRFMQGKIGFWVASSPRHQAQNVILQLAGPSPIMRWHAFDVIRMTNMSRVIPAASWLGVVSLLQDLLVPGGWIELVDLGPIIAAVTGGVPRSIADLDIAEQQYLLLTRGVDLSFIAELAGFFAPTVWGNAMTGCSYLPIGPAGGKIGNLMRVWYNQHILQLKQRLLSLPRANTDSLERQLSEAIISFRKQPLFVPIFVTRAQMRPPQ